MTRAKDNFEITAYKGELTKQCIAENSIKLKRAFPALPPDFFDIFADRIKQNEFSNERLIKAVNFVIDNCVYPTPTIAQFLSYDKKVKVYSYHDMLKLNDQMMGEAFKLHKAVKIGNNPFPVWASLNDIESYGLELWENK